MTGVSTVQNIYAGRQSRPGEPTLVNLLRRDIYGHPFSEVLSASGCCCGAASHSVLWRLATDLGFVG